MQKTGEIADGASIFFQNLQEICDTHNNSSLHSNKTSLDDVIRSCKMKNFDVTNPMQAVD
jgi:hypothetical protein